MVQLVNDFGLFARYYPAANEMPAGYEGVSPRDYVFCQNEAGQDFYSAVYAQSAPPTGHDFALVQADGLIVSVARDPLDMSPPGRTRLPSPVGFRVIQLRSPKNVDLLDWNYDAVSGTLRRPNQTEA